MEHVNVNLQFYLWHDLYTTIFKIKRELNIVSGSASMKENFWVCAYFFVTRQTELNILT